MSDITKKRLSREEIAKIEIGHTDISQSSKWFIVLFFLAFISIYPITQFFYDQPFTKWKKSDTIQKTLSLYERSIEETSILRRYLLTPAQRFMLSVFKNGNEKVIVGKDGWLFFSGDYEYLINPGFLRNEKLHKRRLSGVQPDPIIAIRNFNEQLQKRGIRLILVPVPVKPMIYADMLNGCNAVLQNNSFSRFKTELEKSGIAVVDLAETLVDMRGAGVETYLKTDSHWTPEAMDAAARKTVSLVTSKSDFVQPEKSCEIANLGDIAVMLNLPDCTKYFPSETVSLKEYKSQIDTNAEILLLGDSFTNIYSVQNMGWGSRSGFAEAVSHYAGQAVDTICQNDSGAFVTRQMLANELKRGRDRLDGKKVVIWEFAIRELTNGDWKIQDLTLQSADGADFPEIVSERIVEAIIIDKSATVKPYTTPYKDHIITLHIGNMDGGNGQAVVYIPGMLDNKLTAVADLRPGEKIKVKLIPFEKLERKFGSLSRSEIEKDELLVVSPCWGELLKK